MGSDQMPSLNRDDIHIIARHSNLNEEGIAKTLKVFVYTNSASWRLFLRLFFLALGVSFTLAGNVCFFSYNWADLNKFAKIGIILGLVIVTSFLAMIPKFSITVRNILLTGASVLVGVLFAVFGQIYQTGANAYDFFLAWTICITIWVLLSDFAPLWAIYLALINITIALYSAQVANTWEGIPMITALTILNAIVLACSIFLNANNRNVKIPLWFTNSLALVVVYMATMGVMMIIFDRTEPVDLPHLIVTAILYAAGCWYGLRYKRAFYLSIIPFSLILIISAKLIEISDGAAMFLTTSIFVIASVTFLIMQLIRMQKKWANEAGK
jgi:uncharacterized membrane protein